MGKGNGYRWTPSYLFVKETSGSHSGRRGSFFSCSIDRLMRTNSLHSVRLREAIYACMSGTPLLLLADKWVKPESKHQVFQRKERVTTYWSLSFNWDSLSDNPFEWLPSTLLWFIWNVQSTSINILPHK